MSRFNCQVSGCIFPKGDCVIEDEIEENPDLFEIKNCLALELEDEQDEDFY